MLLEGSGRAAQGNCRLMVAAKCYRIKGISGLGSPESLTMLRVGVHLLNTAHFGDMEGTTSTQGLTRSRCFVLLEIFPGAEKRERSRDQQSKIRLDSPFGPGGFPLL